MRREIPPKNLLDRLGRALNRRCCAQDDTKLWVYHRVHPSASTDNIFGLKVSPELFEAQLKTAISKAVPVFADQLLDSGWPMQKGPSRVAFTFDDGYADNYSYVLPLLKKYRVPCTIFLNSDWVGNSKRRLCDRLLRCVQLGTLSQQSVVDTAWRIHHLNSEEQIDLLEKRWKYPLHEEEQGFVHEDRSLNVQQIQEMQQSGWVRFEAHGHAHLSYGRLALTEIEQDLKQNIELIERWTGRVPQGLAYPFGQVGDWRPELEEVLANCKLRWAMLALGQWNSPYTHPYVIDRSAPQGGSS